MELLGDMASRDHLIIADYRVSQQTRREPLWYCDDEVPALFTNKISPISLDWPTYCRPPLYRRASSETDRRRYSTVAGTAHRL